MNSSLGLEIEEKRLNILRWTDLLREVWEVIENGWGGMRGKKGERGGNRLMMRAQNTIGDTIN